MEVREPARFVGEIDDESVAPVVKALLRRLVHLDHIGLGYRSLDRPSATLSGGESQRVKLVRHRPTRCPSTRGTTGSMSSDGRLRLLLGEEDLAIEPGKAVEFTTWTPHWFGALDGPVELILIVGPQGERLHLHA